MTRTTNEGYVPKPYEQMTHPEGRVQIDVKVLPRIACIYPIILLPNQGFTMKARVCAAAQENLALRCKLVFLQP